MIIEPICPQKGNINKQHQESDGHHFAPRYLYTAL
jgi:hypothetical protein